MQHQQGQFQSFDGLSLFYQSWKPAQEPRAVIVIIHGSLEHSSRYNDIASHLVNQGYAVYAFDMRGHGRSGGERVFIRSFETIYQDVDAFLDYVRKEEPKGKIFLLGHSVGAAITVAFLITRTPTIAAGAILSAPPLKNNSSVPFPVQILTSACAFFFPRLKLYKLNSKLVSRDRAVIASYDNDPLVYKDGICAATLQAFIHNNRMIQKQMERLTTPFLVMHGTADYLSDMAGSQELFARASATDKTIKLFDNFYHELFNEPGREKVFDEVARWIELRLGNEAFHETEFLIPDKFENTARQFPLRIAFQYQEGGEWRYITYQELLTSVVKIAGFLLKQGLGQGDCTAIVLENRPQWPMVYLGALKAGLTCVPIDPHLSPEEIKNLLINSASKALFCSYELWTQLNNAGLPASLSRTIVLDAEGDISQKFMPFTAIDEASGDILHWPKISSNEIASLLYTSGTTGQPKGVMLSHKNICANFHSINKLNLYYPSDNVLALLPLYHTYAFMVTLITPLFLGGRVTFCPSGFKPEDLAGIIRESEVSLLIGIPRVFALFLSAILEKLKPVPSFLRSLVVPLIRHELRQKFGKWLRLFVSGGARLEAETSRDITKYFGLKILNGYGITETSPVVTLTRPDRIRFGTVGTPIPDVKIKILDPDKEGIGEILISGANVFKGYFKQPELTTQAIENSWFHSNDLGFIDKDGNLHIAGRKNDVIILASGKNIYPEELDEYYGRSPFIKEICTITREEKVFGHNKEVLFAVIVPNLDYFKKINETNINDKIRWELENMGKALPAYKHLMGFALTTTEFPRNALRKIKRFEVRNQFHDALHQVDANSAQASEGLDLNETATAKKTIEYISSQVSRPVTQKSHLEIDLGIDSLTRIELALGLEAIFKIKIPEKAIYQVATIKDLIELVSSLRQEASAVSSLEKEDWIKTLLKQPDDETLAKIELKTGFFEYILTGFFKIFYAFWFKILWFLRIKRTVSLPEAPFLICPNHASFLDGLIIFNALPFKLAIKTYFLGYQHIFEHPLLKWANRSARLVSIDNSQHLNEAMRTASYLLKQGKIVCVFPEGQRSIDTNVAKFKKGAAILIKELGIPVIPVYIQGSHQAWPRGKFLPRIYPIKVTLGKPLTAADLAEKGKKFSSADEYDAIAQALREEVLKLSSSAE
ncbi:MAG: alpha/beta fold hydrolase [Candidatus Omnitrophica bacterium]|nr:alpha/beta fold hydrolase [Candidatus Omnitrophota bacterium]